MAGFDPPGDSRTPGGVSTSTLRRTTPPALRWSLPWQGSSKHTGSDPMSQRRGLLRSNPFADARHRDGKDAKVKQNFDHLRNSGPIRGGHPALRMDVKPVQRHQDRKRPPWRVEPSGTYRSEPFLEEIFFTGESRLSPKASLGSCMDRKNVQEVSKQGSGKFF